MPSNAQIFPEAEKGFLGGIIYSPAETAELLSKVTPEFFTDHDCRNLFVTLSGMDTEKISPETVQTALREQGKQYLLSFVEDAVDSSCSVTVTQDHYEKIFAAYKNRELQCCYKDISRYYKEGNQDACKKTRTEIQKLEEAQPFEDEDVVSGEDILRHPPAEIYSVVEGVFDLGDKVAIIAPAKMRKTFFTLQLAMSLSAGKDFLGMKISKPFRVLFVQLEIAENHFFNRVKSVARALNFSSDELKILHIKNGRGEKTDFSQILLKAKRLKAEIIIFDPLYKLIDGDENSADGMKPVLAEFDRLARRLKAAVIFVHHDSKGTPGDRNVRDRGAGSGVLARDYDACIILTEHCSAPDAIVCQLLLRNYPEYPKFVIEFKNNGFFVQSELPAIEKNSSNKRKKQEISLSPEKLREISDCSMMEFRDRLKNLGLTDGNVRKSIHDVLRDGVLKKGKIPQCRNVQWIATPERLNELQENPSIQVSGCAPENSPV